MKRHWSWILMLFFFFNLTSWVPLDKSCPSCGAQFHHHQKAAEGGYKDKETKAKEPWRGIRSAPLGESWVLAQFWFRRCWPTASAMSSPGPSRLPVSISSREPEVNQGDLEHLRKLRQRLCSSSGVMPQESYSVSVGHEQVCFSRFWPERGHVLFNQNKEASVPSGCWSLIKRLVQGASLEYLPNNPAIYKRKYQYMGCLLFAYSVLAKVKTELKKTDLLSVH